MKLFQPKVPQMPEGYYFGDKPNPNLRAFVEQHIKENPYDPLNDDYNVPAFDKPIETTKATAIYNMHTYWSKKPHDAIRQYIRHYTKPGDLVLDPFCGSGGTGLAALMEGCKAILIDRSPAATFIAKNYCTPVDVDELQKAFEELKRKVKPEIDWLYETRCDRCGGKATTGYTVYSQVFQCPRCLEKVPLFDCVEVDGETAKDTPKKISACPHCYQSGIVEEISTRAKKFGAVPVLVSYLCESGCRPARRERRYNDSNQKKREYFEKYDLGKIREIEAKEIPYWYPKDRMMHVESDTDPWGDEWRPGRDFRTVAELFTKRNLWALAVYLKAIDQLDGVDLRSLLTWAMLKCSKMMRFCDDGIGRITSGTYYIPQISRDSHVPSYIAEAFGDFKAHHIKKLLTIADQPFLAVLISTEDAKSQVGINDNSIDYIFTDPPYAEKVQYGELNFIWEAWLGLDTHWHDEEIIVNEVRGKTEEDWANLIRQAMAECYRVLKPGRYISLCYHDTSEGTWALVQDIMAEVGFISEMGNSALYIDTNQKTLNQMFADKVNKRDLVINFRKPKPGEVTAMIAITGDEDKTTFNEKVHQIIREYLGAHPGFAKDRIYDEVVSRMVRRGEMEAHDFEGLLCQIAEPVHPEGQSNGAARWYLKETELAVEDQAESKKEEAAAGKLVSFMQKDIQEHPEKEGVHYSDLFEQVIQVADKPRRPMAEWLPDFFYKTAEGTWRLPDTEEEERVKREGRSLGIGRRIKRYLSFLEQGIPVSEKERPSDATLASWIRHAKRAGLYEQGKLLYEKGGLHPSKLTEEQQADVEEDYGICVRSLARGLGEVKQKREAKLKRNVGKSGQALFPKMEDEPVPQGEGEP
jgi:DNA modification methylase